MRFSLWAPFFFHSKHLTIFIGHDMLYDRFGLTLGIGDRTRFATVGELTKRFYLFLRPSPRHLNLFICTRPGWRDVQERTTHG